MTTESGEIKNPVPLSEEEKALVDKYIELLKTNRKDAEKFYKEEIFPRVLKRIAEQSEFVLDKIQKIYGYEEIVGLIQTVGFSIEPLQMVQEAIGPEKIFYIATKDTAKIIDQLFKFNELPLSSINHVLLENNVVPEKIYEIIRDKIKSFFEGHKNVVVDITGGKKSISGGALLAANLLRLPVVYVDYKKYLPELRKPMPFTEFIHVFEPPETIISDVEEEKIVALLQNYNFSKAYEISNDMSRKARNPLKFFVYKYLAKGYQLWENLNYSSALEQLKMALDATRKYKYKFGSKSQVENNIAFLEELTKIFELQKAQQMPLDSLVLTSEYSTTLFIVDFLNRAERLKKLGKFDFCVLLLYRTLELLVQHILYKYGINPHEPNIKQYLKFASTLKTTIQDIEEAVSMVRKKLFGLLDTDIKESPKIDFSRKITLLDGAILLKATKIDVFKDFNLDKLRTYVELRNKSVLAHGLSKVDEKRTAGFLKFVRDSIENILSQIYPKWKTWLSNAEFPTADWKLT